MNEVDKLVEWVAELLIQNDPRTSLKIYNRCLSGEEITKAYRKELPIIEDLIKLAKQILSHVEPIIRKQEREEIRQLVMNKYNGAYPDGYCDAIIDIWNTLKE